MGQSESKDIKLIRKTIDNKQKKIDAINRLCTDHKQEGMQAYKERLEVDIRPLLDGLDDLS